MGVAPIWPVELQSRVVLGGTPPASDPRPLRPISSRVAGLRRSRDRPPGTRRYRGMGPPVARDLSGVPRLAAAAGARKRPFTPSRSNRCLGRRPAAGRVRLGRRPRQVGALKPIEADFHFTACRGQELRREVENDPLTFWSMFSVQSRSLVTRVQLISLGQYQPPSFFKLGPQWGTKVPPLGEIWIYTCTKLAANGTL
jgi:hypothetical protein